MRIEGRSTACPDGEPIHDDGQEFLEPQGRRIENSYATISGCIDPSAVRSGRNRMDRHLPRHVPRKATNVSCRVEQTYAAVPRRDIGFAPIGAKGYATRFP